MEEKNKYLILTEKDGKYMVSANTWQEALVKYFKYCGSYGGITFSDFSKLIETRDTKESVELFNHLQMHEDDIETFLRIGGTFVCNNVDNIDDDMR